MKTIKSIVFILFLAIAACRSVPSDVNQAHQLSKVESAAALSVAEDTLEKIEDKSAELNNTSVTAAFDSWATHLKNIQEARIVVQNYLVQTKAGDDLTGPYNVANQLLLDMNGGFVGISVSWADMIKPEREVDAVKFIALFRKDIERYRVLQRKFDEWINQFKVKD